MKEILAELKAIKCLLVEIHKNLTQEKVSIKNTLKRRGFYIHRWEPQDNLIFLPDCPGDSTDNLYEILKKYSFRIFLRDVINKKDSFRAEDLTKFCSLETAKSYLKFMFTNNLIIKKRGGYYTIRNPAIRSFGDTLEWFISQILIREFDAQSSWGIKLNDTQTGGDYDVMARVEQSLIYIEAKSSPPKHIQNNEIKAFLDRVKELSADLSIFLVDTELRMKDKIVLMFEEELAKRLDQIQVMESPVSRWIDEIFSIGDRILISNSKPNIITNLGRCLRWHFSKRIR